MAEVWFIRHGQSIANAGQVTEGTASVPLTALGHQQALAVSTLITTAPDLIVVTPYLRTQQTAVPTLEKFPDVGLEPAGICLALPRELCDAVSVRLADEGLLEPSGSRLYRRHGRGVF
jgi:broad specificity phosphatase PhoE